MPSHRTGRSLRIPLESDLLAVVVALLGRGDVASHAQEELDAVELGRVRESGRDVPGRVLKANTR